MSGSGGASGGADVSSSGEGGAAGTGGAACEPRVLLLLDRSASMQEVSSTPPLTRWEIVAPPIVQLLNTGVPSLEWGLKVFPEGSTAPECAPQPTALTEWLAPGNNSVVSNAVAAVAPTGNGTPTGEIVRSATVYLEQLGGSAPTYLLLVTDGQPSCVGTVSDSGAARVDTVAAITDAASAGYHTFVIGIETTKITVEAALNDMARAGLEPRPTLNPLDRAFYLATSPSDTTTALETIVSSLHCP